MVLQVFSMWVKCQFSHITGWATVLWQRSILELIHKIFNLRDTDIGICIILGSLKRGDDLSHHLNIRHCIGPSQDIIGKQLSTLTQHIIVNVIFRHLCASDRIHFNGLLIIWQTFWKIRLENSWYTSWIR
jgi:hypothetical protein